MKYRIKSKQCFNMNRFIFGTVSEVYAKSKYYVQYKYKYIPFWITISSSFDKLEQAKEHIKLKLEEQQ